MRSTTLCDYSSEEIDIHVTAYLENGALSIEGQDLGERVRQFWGEDEHEYIYSLSVENTKKFYANLCRVTGSSKDLLILVKDCFSGPQACGRFNKFCKLHSIPVSYFSC